MNILITGIHGFIGSNLVNTLKEHHPIYGMDIVTPQKEGVLNTFVWSKMDRIPPVEIIIHLAGIAHDTKNKTKAQEYLDINVGLTQKIFQHFLKSTATKFIFFSSVKAVADSVIGDQLFEEVLPNPKTPYGRSKLEAEKYIKNELGKWEEEQTMNGIDHNWKKVYILRPCMIHGPGNKGNLNLLYQFAQKDIPWPLGAYKNQRSFCSLENLVYVIHNLIEKDLESDIYQVADDESLSTNDIIKLLADSLNKKLRIWNIPKWIIRLAAKLGDHLHLPLNSERLQKLTESYVVSNSKLKIALGIDRMPFSALNGMALTIESFKR